MFCPELKMSPLYVQGHCSSSTQPPRPSDSRPGGHTQPETQGVTWTPSQQKHVILKLQYPLSHCQQSAIIHSQCPASGSSFDTVLLGFPGPPLRSPRKPWDWCTLVKRTACYQGEAQIIQIGPQNGYTHIFLWKVHCIWASHCGRGWNSQNGEERQCQQNMWSGDIMTTAFEWWVAANK